MDIVLRDYQEESINRILASYEQDKSGSELVVLPTGCHRKGQGILMFDGTVKPVEEIVIGDWLMGENSLPVRVLELHRGQDEMIEVCPLKGDSWVVNKGHILSLVQRSEHPNRPYPSSNRNGEISDVPISDWMTWSDNKKSLHKLYRAGVNFPHGELLPMNPYLLGVLLGDGSLAIAERVQLTSIDEEVVFEVERILHENGFHLHPLRQENRTQAYHISARIGHGRPENGVRTIKRIMAELGLLPIRCEDRFIPHIFKTASRQDRLELLAGLIDTDGSLDKIGFDYCSKSQQLANDVCFVARSLGLAAYKSPRLIDGTTYYRVFISGDCSIIPTRIPRKQASSIRKQKKNVQRVGFTCKPTGTIEDYYGFTVDGDNRYLLDDFTVTHNSGKTVIFSQVIYQLAQKYDTSAMVIADRDELLNQAADKYRMVKPDAVIGKVGSGVHEYGGEVTIASIQTIYRPEHIKRLKALYGTGKGLLIIVDEADLSAAPTYQIVLEAFPDAFVLMVTATPDRLDGKPLLDGKKPLYEASIIDLAIHEPAYLTDMRAIPIQTNLSLDGLHTQAGDFKIDELEAAVDTDERNQLIVQKYQQYANGRRAACFAVTVEHAQHITEAFNDAGIASGVVVGTTPLPERKRLYKAFRDGSVKVLTTVNVLSRGWDEPLCDCIIMARPTQSRALFVQAIGRGLRLAPGKKDCIILDITDNCLKHRLEPQSLRKVLGKHINDEESLLEALEREKEESEVKVSIHQERKLKEQRNKDIELNLLVKLEWQQEKNGMFVLTVGSQKHRIALVPDAYGEMYSVWARLAPFYEPQLWLENAPLDWCQSFAEKRARLLLSDAKNAVLIDRNASWRLLPAKETQLERLERWAHRFNWSYNPQTITRGEASDLIDYALGQFETWRNRKGQKVS